MPPPRRVRVPHEVSALVRGLHPALKRKVRAALQALLDDPYAGKALCNELQGLRSYRVGRLRIIYRLRRDVELVAIGPRDSIYVETYRRIHEPRGRYRLPGSPNPRGSSSRRFAPIRTSCPRMGAAGPAFVADSRLRAATRGLAPQSAASSYASGGGQAQARWRSP